MNRQMTWLVTPLLFLGFCIAAMTTPSSLKAAESTGISSKKIMIVGVAQDDKIRRNFEDEFVRQLTEVGAKATPSYDLFTIDQLKDKAQRPQVEAKLKELGYHQVIVTSVLSKRTEVMGQPTSGAWFDYSDESFKLADQSGAQADIATLECKVFDLATGKPIGTHKLETQTKTGTITAESSQKVFQPFVKVVVQNLKKEKLI